MRVHDKDLVQLDMFYVDSMNSVMAGDFCRLYFTPSDYDVITMSKFSDMTYCRRYFVLGME